MPGGDGTGPMGMGAMTGRGLGYCAGYAQPGFATGPGRGFGYGFGFGGGRGWGRGRRNRFWATGVPGWLRAGWGAYTPPMGQPYPTGQPFGYAPSADEERGFLESQIRVLQEQLNQMQQRVQELSAQDAES